MFCLKNDKPSCLRVLNTNVFVAKSSFPNWILWEISPYFALFTLRFRWILAHKCAVFEERPAFPGVIFCKIHTQSHTKGYMHGHLNAHVKSDKTADHRSRTTIKNKELSHAFWGRSDVQQMESARVVKPDEVSIGHLTPAEFWSALTISLFSTTLKGWTDAFNSCFRMQCAAKSCKVMCYSPSEAGDVLQTASLSLYFYLGVTDRFLTAYEVGWDSFVGQSELHAQRLSPGQQI
jgi:hypothetical protein